MVRDGSNTDVLDYTRYTDDIELYVVMAEVVYIKNQYLYTDVLLSPANNPVREGYICLTDAITLDRAIFYEALFAQNVISDNELRNVSAMLKDKE